MRRYGKEFIMDQDVMDTVSIYMDKEIREQVHFELAPCTPEEFLIRYIELDPEFEELLKSEFSIEL